MTEDRRPTTDDGIPRTKDEMTGFPISTSVSTSICSFPGVLLQPLVRAEDSRGWLTELFRADVLEADGMRESQPVMGYLSMTLPGVVRGPHEHHDQTDLLVFAGPSDFEVTLWDNRPGSPTFGRRETLVLGASRPGTLIVPSAVVHAYRNVGKVEGWVLNFPNRLYKGPVRRGPVDEIRHEDDPGSSFKVEVKAEARTKDKGPWTTDQGRRMVDCRRRTGLNDRSRKTDDRPDSRPVLRPRSPVVVDEKEKA